MNIVRRLVFPLSFFLFPLLTGCAVIGVAAHKLTPPPTVQPEYTRLQNESIGVMVWPDRGIRIDWPGAQLDLANAVQTRLKQQQEKGKKKTLRGATFPVLPASIIRYQRDHPEIEAMTITDVAPRFGVSRLIYVELEDFATRADASVQLFRGTASASVRVIEIKDHKATVAFEQNHVIAAFPRKGPPDGVPNAGDYKIYVGTITELANEIVNLFVPYQVEE